MVDTQAQFALEHRAAIVEPCVKRTFGMDMAQTVGQSQIQQVLKPLPFDGRTVDFFIPFFRVVTVRIGRRDIEIAQQHQFAVTGHFVADKLRQCGKPLFLIFEFGAVQSLAVDAIDIDDAHAADSRRNHAALRVIRQGRQTEMYVLRHAAADYRHAVVGFLPAPNTVPAHHLQGGGGELVLIEFEFL